MLQDWTLRDEFAGVDIAGLDNDDLDNDRQTPCPVSNRSLLPSNISNLHQRSLYVFDSRGATTFSKLGGPIPWSRLLYRTKYGWYTQFRALQSTAT